MAGADIALGTKSQSWSERCSSYSLQCLAAHLCYAKGKAVCVCVCAFCNLVSSVCAIVHEHLSALFLDCQTLLVTRFVGCHYRKRYVNPYDRTDTVQQAEELKRMNEDNNLSLTSRSAVWFSFVHVLLQ